MQATRFAIIAPCFNEATVVGNFLKELDTVLADLPGGFLVVLVDDGSQDDTAAVASAYVPRSSNMVLQVIKSPYNRGHQHAIYDGLVAASSTEAQRFIVMDSDGEDDPAAIKDLVRLSDKELVFVTRGKRSESWGFKLGYLLYRVLFKLLTRRSIDHGNYSMIGRNVLQAVMDHSFVHYPAFLSRSQFKQEKIVYDRRPRIDGRSKMNFTRLSDHAFRSLIEYSEEILSRFLGVLVFLIITFMLTIIAIIIIKVFTERAIPGWASILTATLFNCIVICAGFFSLGSLLVNTTRRREKLRGRTSIQL